MSDTILTQQQQILIFESTPTDANLNPAPQALIVVVEGSVIQTLTASEPGITLITGPSQIVLVDNSSIQILTAGTQGPAGQGLPTGGAIGQYLKKNSGADFDYGWAGIADIPTHTIARAL